MSEAERFIGIPSKTLDAMGEAISPPAPGSGRARIDFSFNVWTFAFLVLIVLLMLIAMDRLHTAQGIQAIELKSQGDLLKILNERQARMESGQIIMRRDLRSFPLHRHVGGSRMEIYPLLRDEDEENVRNR